MSDSRRRFELTTDPNLLGASWRTGLRITKPKSEFIEPGKPNQNAFIEHFNRIYREEVLDPVGCWPLSIRAGRKPGSSCSTTTRIVLTTRCTI